MLFSGKIRIHDVAWLTARCDLFCHDSPLFAAIRDYSYYSLFGFSRHRSSDKLDNERIAKFLTIEHKFLARELNKSYEIKNYLKRGDEEATVNKNAKV